MTEEKTVARIAFGKLIKRWRSVVGKDRGRLAQEAGIDFIVLQRLEHGIVNPSRHEIEKVISVLKLSQDKKDQAYLLLNIFSPPEKWVKKWKRVKFDSKHFRAQRRQRTSNLRRACHR